MTNIPDVSMCKLLAHQKKKTTKKKKNESKDLKHTVYKIFDSISFVIGDHAIEARYWVSVNGSQNRNALSLRTCFFYYTYFDINKL